MLEVNSPSPAECWFVVDEQSAFSDGYEGSVDYEWSSAISQPRRSEAGPGVKEGARGGIYLAIGGSQIGKLTVSDMTCCMLP